jgi:hypothetical protein
VSIDHVHEPHYYKRECIKGCVSRRSAPSDYPRRDWDSTPPATCLWAREYKNNHEAFCQVCPAGHYKNSSSHLLCSKCPPNYATNTPGSLACEPCAADMTTDWRTGQAECVWDQGLPPDSGGSCRTCSADSFKDWTVGVSFQLEKVGSFGQFVFYTLSSGQTTQMRCSLRVRPLLKPVPLLFIGNRGIWRTWYVSLLRDRVCTPVSPTTSRTLSVRNFLVSNKKIERKRVFIVSLWVWFYFFPFLLYYYNI